jgi:hypothetical protein
MAIKLIERKREVKLMKQEKVKTKSKAQRGSKVGILNPKI